MKQLNILCLCLFFIVGCQRNSGNIWRDNQTGAAYFDKYSPYEQKQEVAAPKTFPYDDEFIGLNEEDLKSQFHEAPEYQSKVDLGEADVPSIDQFISPKGELKAILSPIFFDTDRYTINPMFLEVIRNISVYLKKRPNMYLILEGHCDERGPQAYNLSLGDKRANEIRSLLIKEGISPDRLYPISYGKDRPFVTGHSPEAWSQNRRVHFKVSSK